MLKQELQKRNLPELKSREEMVEIMQREVYGYLPKNDFEWSVANYKRRDGRLAKGNVIYSTVDFTLTNDNGSHTFPVHQFLHTDGEKHPTFLHIAGRYPGNFVPEEEIVENGYNLIIFVYTEITSDDDDFTTGIAPLVFPNGRTNDTDCGKIGLWAFASMRVLDYALTLDCVDEKNIAIVGATGKCEDHTIGNISLLMEYMRMGMDVRSYTDYGIFIPCKDTVTFGCRKGQQVSIFNFTARGMKSKGLAYPIYDFTSWWQGTLNRCTDTSFTIEAEGEYLVYLNY